MYMTGGGGMLGCHIQHLASFLQVSSASVKFKGPQKEHIFKQLLPLLLFVLHCAFSNKIMDSFSKMCKLFLYF